jgi:hypothetical protein
VFEEGWKAYTVSLFVCGDNSCVGCVSRVFSLYECYFHAPGSRDSAVGIATGYRLDGRCSIPGRDKIFLFTASRPALGSTQPPIQWVTEALSPGREADHSLPSIAEVKNGDVPPFPHTSSWNSA